MFRTFLLFFRRAVFTPSARLGNKSFPEFAFEEGRLWETKVRTSLSDVVFDRVFPGLIRALASTDPNAAQPLTPVYLNRVREAALTMLYRPLFALYAEDRDLLPTRDRRFDDALSVIRDDIADRHDRADPFTNRSRSYWDHCVALFRIIAEGDQTLGIPPYNGAVATFDMVVEERQRSTGRKGVEPQRDLGQLYRHRVFVHAINAAFEHHAFDQIGVGELLVAYGPAVRAGLGENPDAA